MKSPSRVVPKACIKQRVGVTFCNRVIGEKEFVFDDFGYAVKIYDAQLYPGTSIAACEDCVRFVKRDAEKT